MYFLKFIRYMYADRFYISQKWDHRIHNYHHENTLEHINKIETLNKENVTIVKTIHVYARAGSAWDDVIDRGATTYDQAYEALDRNIWERELD